MSTMSRAARVHAPGGPSVIQIEEIDIGDPGPGQALIRNTAIGLNYQDVYQRKSTDMQRPSGLGMEAAGVVEAVGEGVTNVVPGDRVACVAGPGSYATLRHAPAARLVKIPDGVSDEQAAASLMKGMTTEYLIRRVYEIKAGEWVLFYAAAGGVGQIAGQWGKHLGARMIGIAGGPEKCKVAKDAGYEVVIDRKSEDIVERVKEITGGAGVPVAFDSAGKDTYEQTLKCMAPRGYFVSFGSTSGSIPCVKPGELLSHGSLYFTRPTLVTYTASREDLELSAGAVFDLVAKGIIKVDIGQRYALDDVVKAHEDLEAGRTVGSSIIQP